MPETRKLNYIGAINAALDRALRMDHDVLVFGEDLAAPGGIFGATRGLMKTYPDRVFDTPISESAILGSAVGASLAGMRPIVEIMWVDFSLVALDQIVNQAANVRYVSQSRLTAPMTVRTQQGAMPGSCAQHSQNLEAIFAHIPGLRVCLPSNPQDAYDLLLSSVAVDDPAIVIENRALYFGEEADVEVEGEIAPVGGGRIVRPGRHCTIATWSAFVDIALVAADKCLSDGIDVEVIDLRWLAPLDDDLIRASVQRTGNLLVLHEANVTGGFGAEVVARIAEGKMSGTSYRRLGVPDCRIPAAPHLQAALIPDAERVVTAVKDLVRN